MQFYQSGEHQLYLPALPSAQYEFDGQIIKQSETVKLEGVNYNRFLVSGSPGEHEIGLLLSSLASLDLGEGQACNQSDTKYVTGLDLDENANYFSSRNPLSMWKSSNISIRCWRYQLPDNLNQKVLVIKQDSQTDNDLAYSVLNLHPLQAFNFPLRTSSLSDGQLLVTDVKPYDVASYAIVLPKSDNKTLTLNSLSITPVFDNIANSLQQIITTVKREKLNEAKLSYLVKGDQALVDLSANDSGTYLVFSRDYHPGWQLVDKSGRLVGQHFMSAMKQNVWWIPAGVNGELRVVFGPRNKIVFASCLSLLSLIGVIYALNKAKK